MQHLVAPGSLASCGHVPTIGLAIYVTVAVTMFDTDMMLAAHKELAMPSLTITSLVDVTVQNGLSHTYKLNVDA